jgi:hypothetical protein
MNVWIFGREALSVLLAYLTQLPLSLHIVFALTELDTPQTAASSAVRQLSS